MIVFEADVPEIPEEEMLARAKEFDLAPGPAENIAPPVYIEKHILTDAKGRVTGWVSRGRPRDKSAHILHFVAMYVVRRHPGQIHLTVHRSGWLALILLSIMVLIMPFIWIWEFAVGRVWTYPPGTLIFAVAVSLFWIAFCSWPIFLILSRSRDVIRRMKRFAESLQKCPTNSTAQSEGTTS